MKLEELRTQIDEIDERLFALLQQRLQVVGRVGEHKRSLGDNRYIIRAGREALKVQKAFQMAKEAGINEDTARAMAYLWRSIISLSINHEEKLVLGCAGGAAGNNLREFFGAYSNVRHLGSEDDVLKALTSNKVNVAGFSLDATPKKEPWWLGLSRQNDLNVFASAPLFADGAEATFLVSRVTPEPCGEDKFLYVISGKLPEEDEDNFTIISSFGEHHLAVSEEFYNDYQAKLKARYLGCYAVISL